MEERNWTYDPAGNRLVSDDGTTAMTAFYNELNQIEREGGAGQTLVLVAGENKEEGPEQ